MVRQQPLLALGAVVVIPDWVHEVEVQEPAEEKVVLQRLDKKGLESEDEGQMALHLDRMKRHGCEPDEAGRMGMLLCACKTAERVDPEETERSGIQLAT